MNMKVWKKNAVLASVILFVCVAVYLNWSYNRGEELVVSRQESDLQSEGALSGTILVDGESEPLDEEDALLHSEDLAPEEDYFSTARLTREQARDSSIRILKETLENETLSQETRDQASTALNVLGGYAMSEAQIESLVIAKGYRDCVAFINENGVDLVVAAMGAGLKAEDVSRIKDIVIDKTNAETGQITIIEVAE